MATLNIEIYEALREAKVSEDSARKAATAVAELGGNFESSELKADVRTLRADVAELKSDMKVVRSDVADIKGRLLMLHWMAGFTLAAIMAVLWKMMK
jgi:hypothetical protein